MKWKLDEFLKVTGGKLIHKKQDQFDRISYDTRIAEDVPQSAFFALKGEQQDGHQFLKDAIYKKASLLVIEDKSFVLDEWKDQISIIQVKDTIKTLSQFASYWRDKMTFKVIAITGSNGKTSTKNFTRTLLDDGGGVQASPSSFNNELGICLSLLKTKASTHTLIQEVGISTKGEMQDRLNLLRPDISICTTLGQSHSEGLGSVEAIADEKEFIYQAPSVTQGIFNLDNPFTKLMKSRFTAQSLSFSSHIKTADIYLKISDLGLNYLEITGHINQYPGQCRIPLSGAHQITNIMAALSLALVCGKNPKALWSRLPFLKSTPGRCEWTTLSNQIEVFYDAYNSNPQSMKSFLEHMKVVQGEKNIVLCIGDMLELGTESKEAHQKIGSQVATLGDIPVFFIGKNGVAFKEGLAEGGYKGDCMLFNNYNKDFVSKIFSVIKHGEALAIKSSRGWKLERLLDDLSHYQN